MKARCDPTARPTPGPSQPALPAPEGGRCRRAGRVEARRRRRGSGAAGRALQHPPALPCRGAAGRAGPLPSVAAARTPGQPPPPPPPPSAAAASGDAAVTSHPGRPQRRRRGADKIVAAAARGPALSLSAGGATAQRLTWRRGSRRCEAGGARLLTSRRDPACNPALLSPVLLPSRPARPERGFARGVQKPAEKKKNKTGRSL